MSPSFPTNPRMIELIRGYSAAPKEESDGVVDEQDNQLCECGLHTNCNLDCIFGSEVEKRQAEEGGKLAGVIPLAPGEFIENGKVWYCADKLSG